MIEWEKLVDKYGKQLISSRFEQLALEYVKDVYSEYTWIPTPTVGDGNKDAYLGEGVDFDIWEEAKFKGKPYNIRRQDLDTTILSGILQGNVRMIIFVSNALVPEHLYSRADITASMKGIEVTYALKPQLESWICCHTDIFKNIFKEDVIIKPKKFNAFLLKNIVIYNTFADEFNSLSNSSELIVGEKYILSIIVEASKNSLARIETNDSFPFKIIEDGNFNNADEIMIKKGINTIKFLVLANKEHFNKVNLKVIIEGQPYFLATKELRIYNRNNLPIVYSEQLAVINKIKSLIQGYSNIPATFIISLFAKSGMGKSYILNSIYLDFLFKRDVVSIDFEISKLNDINYKKLCKVLLYLNFGNIFLYLNLHSKEEKEYLLKNIQLREKSNDLTVNDFKQLLEGCYDDTIATSIINSLVKKCRRNKKLLISPKDGRINKLLLLDDIQYLNAIQYELIEIICSQIEMTQKNITVVLSGTEGKFETIDKENSFKSLSINRFSINGLNRFDKIQSINNIFLELDNKEIDIIDTILPDSPLLAYEVVYNLISGYDGQGLLSFIANYQSGISGSAIFQNKYKKLDKKSLQLLDIIFIFKLGVRYDLLEQYYDSYQVEIRYFVEQLEKIRIISRKDNIIKPYHDYCISSYKKYRKNKMYSNNTAKFLEFVMKYEYDVDKNLVLSNIIKCGKSYYNKYKKTINEIILNSIHNTNFGTALYYCEYYYNILTERDASSYTKDELYYLYLYSDCLVHCGKSSKAEELFEWLCNLSQFGTIEYTEAGVSLLNQRFWHLNLNEIIGNSIILQNSVEKLLSKQLNHSDFLRMKKAWEGCVNRRMVTHLLLDQYDEGWETYKFALKEFSKRTHSLSDFFAESATIIMDYARGLAYKNVQMTYSLIHVSKKYFSHSMEQQYRRAVLCEIDCLLFENIIGKDFNEKDFNENLIKLKRENFISEYFKASLKYYACKLVEESRLIKRSHGYSFRTSLFKRAYNDIHKIMIDMNFNPEYREKYLYNSIIAYIYIHNNEQQKALKCLNEAKSFIEPAGNSHLDSINHNLTNIEQIKCIEWNYEGQTLDNNCYYLDSRFW